ncbi:TIGR01620 family protein [Chelativorans sp. ZYF759]|uniref:YcjF family protein n=1 Tax=Chelativorans sp. ZYF759 TaxID=2692213 RepID=UPI00145CC476|nr:TIGR01620 family protein [Chelativorans sp. ZYF759]NMG38540.1 TIGR01620 family protein [Chelativorans sp. ZYF759]
MTERRRPASFRIEPEIPPAEPTPRAEAPKARKPRAADPARVEPAEIDVFDEVDALDAAPPPPALPARRRSRLRAVFLWSAGLLVSLAVGLWTEALVRELFARAEWLGWVGLVLALMAVAALVVIIAREAMALARLASVARLHERGREAIAANDPKKARALVDELAGFVAAQPETAAGRRALEELRGDIIDGADLVRLAEVELLAPLDERARRLTLDAAKRVSLVTAVSPRALVDLAYVAFEAARLIRRIAELYGARPGTLGFLRLARNVIAHLAITGALAAGDEFVHQIVGQGLAARLSARLGEGIVNGMMTARIGIAAMETSRPLPFSAIKRPGLSDFLGVLVAYVRKSGRA